MKNQISFTARDRLKLLMGGAALALSGCGGGSSSTSSPPTAVAPPPPPPPPPPPVTSFSPSVGQFRQTFTNQFAIGAAIKDNHLQDSDPDGRILREQFNSVTAEYQMKPEIIAPTEGVYDWTVPDAMVDFAEANNMAVRGHTLLWHRATPDYFFQGTPAEVRARLERYITDVVTRYRGRVFAWDVVNEVVTDDDGASDPYRRSNWWDASGGNADYIDWAFEAARAADPDCLLFINDYNSELSGKLGRYIDVIRDLNSRNIPLDGVGHQMHVNIDTPLANALEAIDAIDREFMGLIQHVTELDISIYSDPGSCFENEVNCAPDYGSNIPTSVMTAQAQLYRDLFEGFAARPSVTSLTIWGLSDADSWLDTYPTTRTNAPLLWDRQREAKSALQAILDPNFAL